MRTLYREKVYALINVIGLALAIACCLILLLYVRSELTYDQHNINHENTYRIAVEFTSNGKTDRFAINSPALGPLLLKDYPQIGGYVRLQPVARTLYKFEDLKIYWDDVYLADDNVFDVFTHKAIYGDLKTALKEPYSIAISRTFSERYFGLENPVGRTISTDATSYTISAVFEDLPDNSHLKYNALTSMNVMPLIGRDDKGATPGDLFNGSDYVYIEVADDMQAGELKRLLDEFYSMTAADIGKQADLNAVYFPQKLASIHFEGGWENDRPTGNIFYVYAFVAVAIFVLLVACINYTNLATARAIKRAKEVGMRKVIGAGRLQLIAQFLGESAIYTFVALLLGLVLLELAEAFTPLNGLLGKTSLLSLADEPVIVAWIIGGTVIVALLAGAYPAFYLSSISPLSAITASKSRRASGIQLRQVLVFLQFFVSVAVLASTLVMQQQMNYVASKPLGFDRENRMVIMLQSGDTLENIQIIKNELLKDSRVLGVSRSSYVPGQDVGLYLMEVETNQGQMERALLGQIAVDEDFVRVMGIEVLEGRDFSHQLMTDIDTSVVVNETLVKQMGWEQPIGKRINFEDLSSARVIGVMKDFHFKSLHEPVAPVFIIPFPKNELDGIPNWWRALISGWIVVSITDADIFRTVDHIDSVISRIDPNHPFEFKFLDEMLQQHYESEVNLMNLTSAFSAICILISCMGLFGLTALTTEQRTKEIGVRKVLGASTLQIIATLSKNLILMVIVAALMASIASYYVMDDSLNAFAYRTDIEIWVFLVASLAVAAVAFLTVVMQAAKTALSNPANALRYE